MSKIIIKAEPESIEIEISKAAILVVDMQNAFISEGGYFDLLGHDLFNARNIIEPCKIILNLAREKGIKIIYLQMGCSPDFSDAGHPNSPYRLKSRALNLIREHPEWREKIYIYGTWGADIIKELEPQPGDILIRKQKYDGFIGTNLDIILRTNNIKYLLFIGIATNICVESTIRHAFFLDYFPILISDAVSHIGPKFIHESSISNVKSTFGWVTNTENLIIALKGVSLNLNR